MPDESPKELKSFTYFSILFLLLLNLAVSWQWRYNWICEMKTILLVTLAFALAAVGFGLTLEEYSKLEQNDPAKILEEVDLGTQENFPGIDKLVFLTPWNKKGFEYSLKYAHKLDYVSPCWYTLQLAKNGLPVF